MCLSCSWAVEGSIVRFLRGLGHRIGYHKLCQAEEGDGSRSNNEHGERDSEWPPSKDAGSKGRAQEESNGNPCALFEFRDVALPGALRLVRHKDDAEEHEAHNS